MNSLLFVWGALLAGLYAPGLLDATTVPRWALSAVMAPLMVCLAEEFQKEGDELPVLWLPLGALALMCIPVLWSADQLGALDYLCKWLALGMCVWAGYALRDLTWFWCGLVVGLMPSVLLAIAQTLGQGPEWIAQSAPPGGLFSNQNFLGEAAAVGLVAALYIGSIPAAICMLVALALAHTLTAWGGTILCGCLWLERRRPKAAYVMFALLVIAALVWFPIKWSRVEDYTGALSYFTLFGNGLASYALQFPSIEHLHNDFLQMMFEQGILALPLAWVVYQVLKEESLETELERSVLLAVVAMGTLSYSMHMPLTATCAALAAGRVLGGRVRLGRMRDDIANHLGIGSGRPPAFLAGSGRHGGKSA